MQEENNIRAWQIIMINHSILLKKHILFRTHWGAKLKKKYEEIIENIRNNRDKLFERKDEDFLGKPFYFDYDTARILVSDSERQKVDGLQRVIKRVNYSNKSTIFLPLSVNLYNLGI